MKNHRNDRAARETAGMSPGKFATTAEILLHAGTAWESYDEDALLELTVKFTCELTNQLKTFLAEGDPVLPDENRVRLLLAGVCLNQEALEFAKAPSAQRLGAIIDICSTGSAIIRAGRALRRGTSEGGS